MPRKPEGPPPPPTVQRLRVHYTKRGRLRFSSHRDFQRAFERALRRAAVPMAYSAGFSPHPKVSYAGAAPTGVASEAEYLEIGLAERCDPERLRAALDASLPDDLDVLEMVEVAPPPANTQAESLADRLEASVWEVRLAGVEPGRRRAGGRRLPRRRARRGVPDDQERAADLRRPGRRWWRWSAAPGPRGRGTPGRARVRYCDWSYATSHRLSDPTTSSPDSPRSATSRRPSTPAVTRLAQGPLDESAGTVSDPLAPDRDAAGA